MTHVVDTVFSNGASAEDAASLVPGNVRALGEASADLDKQATAFGDVITDLINSTRNLPWTGPSASAFIDHRTQVTAMADAWRESVGAVVNALTDHQTALGQAQLRAAEVLELRKQAQRDADEIAHWDADEDARSASNYTALRSQLQAAIDDNQQRARSLLDETRTQLAHAGQDAARTIRQAHQQLHAAALPEFNSGSVMSQPSAAEAGPTVTVLAPHDGKHDSLWAIAQRELGDGNRWREIYDLNAGRRVGNSPHAILANPQDIQPGWTLRLPVAHPQPPVGPAPTPLHPIPAPPALPPALGAGAAPTNPPPSTIGPPTLPTPPVAAPGPHPTPHPQPTPTAQSSRAIHVSSGQPVDFGDGLLIAGGVAAALVAGGIVLRRHTRRSPAEPSAPTAPTIRTFSIDHEDLERLVPQVEDGTPFDASPTLAQVPLGHRDGRTILLDTAETLGLGLTGAGAPAAIRALLISLLASCPEATAVLTAAVHHRLLDRESHPALPHNGVPTAKANTAQRMSGQRLAVTPSLDEALDTIEVELASRTRILEETAGHAVHAPLLLVVPAPDDPRRLNAIAELGAGLSIGVIVLGVWRPNVTCQIGEDGRIVRVLGQSLPDWAHSLPGLRTFSIGNDDTRALLALLRPTKPTPPSRTPATRSALAGTDVTGSPRPGAIARALNPAPHRSERNPISRSITGRLTPPSSDHAEGSDTLTEIAGAPHPRQPTGRSDPPTVLADAPPHPFQLTALGDLQIRYAVQGAAPVNLAAALTPKPREVLLYLAVHRDGVRTSVLTNAIWPGASPARPSNAFHTTLSQLRRCVRALVNDEGAALVLHRGGQYYLNPEVIDVDLWRLTTALRTTRTALDRERTVALEEVVDIYRGDLAQNYTSEWLDEPRETLRREVIDAHAALIRATRSHEPERALGLLERARQLDPHNEAIYRDIMRVQSRLGHFDAISRTMRLLRTALADIDARPTTDTETLAVHLQHAPRPTTDRRTA